MMATILNIVKISEVPEIVERLTQITQYRHSRDNSDNKTFGEILTEELKKFEVIERQKFERELLCSSHSYSS